MTKPSHILIMKAHPLDGFSEFERSIIRRFLFECFRGLNEQYHKRWLRFWSRLWNFEVGQVAQFENVVERSGPFHRRHMAIEQALFDRQERWGNIKHLRNWLKTGAGWGHYELVNGRMKFVPDSTSYESCSDDEMKEIHEAMLAFLRTPYAQRHLWNHLSPNARAEMLESILERPEEQQT